MFEAVHTLKTEPALGRPHQKELFTLYICSSRIVDTMQISIKTNTGETVIIDWEQSDSLESIAGKIQEKTGLVFICFHINAASF